MTATDGKDAAVIRPDQVRDFFGNLEDDTELVFHNASFDVAVLSAHDSLAALTLDEMIDEGNVHDTLLLDQLVRLGSPSRGDTSIRRRSLKEVAQEYCRLSVDKEVVALSPVTHEEVECRINYAHLMGLEHLWPTLDRRWFDYPILDVIATLSVYNELTKRASRVASVAGLRGPVLADLTARHGLLTESIQVKAAIVLDEIGRLGMAVDKATVIGVDKKLRSEMESALQRLQSGYPDLFAKYKGKSKKNPAINPGDYRMTPTGVPVKSAIYLKKLLASIADEYEITPPVNADGTVTTAAGFWTENAADHPFVADWLLIENRSKMLSLVKKCHDVERVTTRYDTLKVTGRTGASGENIQQCPREKWFRDMFVASSGKLLCVADYSAIELCTLAAVLEKRYGRSVLADTLRLSVDPHCWTAAMVGGFILKEFVAEYKIEKSWPQDDPRPRPYMDRRQAAKAINFGVPGGLGPRRLCNYAKANYGVEMTLDEATALRKRLITEVYPELSTYLDETKFEKMADAFDIPLAKTRAVISEMFTRGNDAPSDGFEWTYFVISKTVAGRPYRVDGEMYSEKLVANVWRALDSLLAISSVPSGDPLSLLLRQRKTGVELRQRLFGKTAVTLTGRVRYGCDYGEARNTPFQGLAADGAKLALWALRDWRQVAFVHDEIVVEIDREEQSGEIADIMSRVMSGVVPGIPIKVETHVGTTWGCK